MPISPFESRPKDISEGENGNENKPKPSMLKSRTTHHFRAVLETPVYPRGRPKVTQAIHPAVEFLRSVIIQ